MTVTFDPQQYKITTRSQWEDAAECVAFERDSFGALHQMLAGLPASDRDDTWAEIGQALAECEGPDGFVGPCEMLVISATR